MTSQELRSGDDHRTRALPGGADARTVVGELANEAARLLLGLGPDDELGAIAPTSSPAARTVLQSMRRAASRTRATRETLMLPTANGGRIAVELQLEPMARGAD